MRSCLSNAWKQADEMTADTSSHFVLSARKRFPLRRPRPLHPHLRSLHPIHLTPQPARCRCRPYYHRQPLPHLLRHQPHHRNVSCAEGLLRHRRLLGLGLEMAEALAETGAVVFCLDLIDHPDKTWVATSISSACSRLRRRGRAGWNMHRCICVNRSGFGTTASWRRRRDWMDVSLLRACSASTPLSTILVRTPYLPIFDKFRNTEPMLDLTADECEKLIHISVNTTSKSLRGPCSPTPLLRLATLTNPLTHPRRSRVWRHASPSSSSVR